MESTDVLPFLEQLDDELDDLEDSLSPLLRTTLSDTTTKLPLLDKAKLYVLATYAIESILFSYLRLNGVKAREHPVFEELSRVKQYFDKIKATETPVPKGENPSVDKQAAARFIKAGLSGNDKHDLERAERKAKEKARSHIKLQELSKKRKAETEQSTTSSPSESWSSSESSSENNRGLNKDATTAKSHKKNKSNEKSMPLNAHDPEVAKRKESYELESKRKRSRRNRDNPQRTTHHNYE